MQVITISGLCKTYNANAVPVHALQSVNLGIDKGEFTAIVGPSGSGKTTLLNMLGGLDSPTSGEIFLAGKNITHMPATKMIEFRLRHIGFVFQAYNLIPVFTALENVEFIMLLQGVDKKKRMVMAKELLQAVGLGERLHSRPSQLSGGQQQRVAVARALASQPDFVLADEPTANLDTQSADELLRIMGDLNLEKGITFIFATHDQRVIERARRVVRMQDGRIVSNE
jgi:putative ABC transport system ATP-binding protein